MKSKRILFFITSLASGGAERALLNLLKNIDTNKYEITLKAICAGGPRENEIPNGIKYKPIIKTKNKILLKIFRKLLMFPLFSKIVYKTFINEKYDIEIACLQGIPTYIIQKGNNECKKIAFVCTAISKEFYNNIIKLYKSKDNIINSYKKMELVCFKSEGARREFCKTFGELNNTCVIHNIIDVNQILKDSELEIEENVFSTNCINIVNCSRIVPIKGIDRIIKSAKEIGITNNKYKIYIIGNGASECEYKDFILKNNLYWINILPYKDNIYPYIKNANLYISSSISESFGMSIVEALILGVPIISTNITSLEDIISQGHEQGVMIVENSYDGVYNGLKRYINDSVLRNNMIKSARNNAIYYQNKFMSYYDENRRILEI